MLARNYRPDIPCGVCEKKPAVFVDAECPYDREGWICAKCSKDRDEEMLLPVLNTPRAGQCGYTGSSLVHLGEEILEKAQAIR